MTRNDLLQQLRKQLGFLERSCASYDAGYEDEAIRIAVSIRILVHDTRASTSLLTLLRADMVRIRSTCPIIDSQTIHFVGGLSNQELRIEEGKLNSAKYTPVLAATPERDLFLPWKLWWTQVVYRLSEGDITRRQIVLGATNKDGGAHVDPKLTPEYEALRKGITTVIEQHGDLVREHSMVNANLSDLRQMGYELLASLELRELAETDA